MRNLVKFIREVYVYVTYRFKRHLPDAKVQTGEQITAVLTNQQGKKKCIKK